MNRCTRAERKPHGLARGGASRVEPVCTSCSCGAAPTADAEDGWGHPPPWVPPSDREPHSRGRCLAVALLLAVVLVGCEDLSESKARTSVQIQQAQRVIMQGISQGDLVISSLPVRMDHVDALNALMTQFLVTKGHLSAAALRKQGLVRRLGPQGQELLLDEWGRPLVFQVPAVYPEGLVITTRNGVTKVRPLKTWQWPPDKAGPVQIWSLGPNGINDQGEGDDVLPNF